MLSKLSLRPSKGLYGLLSRNFTNMSDSWYSEEHKALQTTLKKIIDTDINPNVDQWENEGQYPAHEVFKKLGDAGLMGESKIIHSALYYLSSCLIKCICQVIVNTFTYLQRS